VVEIFVSILVLALIVAGMAVGVLMGRKPLQGSCGGMANIGLDGECDICGGDRSRCDEEQRSGLAYEVASSSRSQTRQRDG
jgi:hypothetical protein